MKKQIKAGLPLTAALLCVGAISASAQQIRVTVDGSPVYFNGTHPTMVNGRVLVPLRGVLEKMGANVGWISQSQTVIASKGNMDINLPIGSHTAQVNGKSVSLDVPAMVVGGSTLVPLRFVSEALGADVGWSNATETVAINTTGGTGDVHYRAHRNDNGDGTASNLNNGNGAYAYNGGNRNNYNNGNTRTNLHRNSSRMLVAAGTVIPVRLDNGITSDGNSTGDRFTATVQNTDGASGLPDGTKVEGVVREAIPAQNGKPGVLDLDFRNVILPDGSTRNLYASVINLDNKNITRTSSGRLVAKGGNANNSQLKWVGIGAGAGLLISSVAKGNRLLDTLLGGAAGYLYNQLQAKGASNVKLDTGMQFGMRLNQDFSYNRGQFDNNNQQ